MQLIIGINPGVVGGREPQEIGVGG